MSSIKIITCIYNNLHGTSFGGQDDRKERYQNSLLNLLNISNADFLCYTSEEELEKLSNFYFIENKISTNRLQIKSFDLNKTKSHFLINRYKNVEKVKEGYRSYEIQYCKFHWWWNEDKTYDYYYWFDAGLCDDDRTVPIEYLQNHQIIFFNENFINNIVKLSTDKIFIMAKENVVNFWYPSLGKEWFTKPYEGYHVIGGIFGGHKSQWDWLARTFEEYLFEITLTEKELYFEEQIMSVIYGNNSKRFNIEVFDTWWFQGFKPKGEFDIKWFKTHGPQDDNYYYNKRCYYQIYKDLYERH